MKWYSRQVAILIVVAVLASVLLPVAATAGSTGRKNTAIGATAGAIAAIITHSTGAAIALGAGSVYAWKRYHDAREHEKYYYPSGYGRGYYHAPPQKHHGWHHGRYYGP